MRQQLLQLEHHSGKDILVLGSPTLVRWLLGQELLDELALIVLPIIVGAGVRLFPEVSTGGSLARIGLNLVDVKSLHSGAVQVSYTPAAR